MLPAATITTTAAITPKPTIRKSANPQRRVLVVTRLLRGRRADTEKIEVRLEEPEDEEECPLTLQPMKNDELAFLPGVVFSSRSPRLRRMTIAACGHSFGAMNLLFHFAQNKMQCPLCRQGSEDRLDFRSIPIHCRRAIMDRIIHTGQEEVRRQLREDELVARALLSEAVRLYDRYSAYVYARICLNADTDSNASGSDIFEFRMYMLVHIEESFLIQSSDILHYTLSQRDRRLLYLHLSDLGISSFYVKIVHKEPGFPETILARSEEIPLDFSMSQRFIESQHGRLLVSPLSRTYNAEHSDYSFFCWSIFAGNFHALLPVV